MRSAIVILLGLLFGASMATAQQSYQGHRTAGYANYAAMSGKLSLVDVDGGVDTTFGIGAAYDFGMTPDWVMSVGLDYWRVSEEISGYEWSLRDIIIGGFAKFMFPTQSRSFSPYLGAGLALHMLKAELEGGAILKNSTRYEDSETELGIDLGGGFQYLSAGGLTMIGELRFRDVNDEVIDQTFITFGFLKRL